MTFVPAPGYLPSYNPPLPYVAPVFGGLRPGMAVYVQGAVAPQADSFRVNLAAGPEEDADVALHLNPRFSGAVAVLTWGTLGFRVNLAAGPEEDADVALHLNPRFSGAVAVLNSRRAGRWGDEQRRDLHPLCPGAPFEIVINVTPEGYRILVNGTFYEEFPHRLPPEQVTAVNVDGDLELHSASVIGGGGGPSCVPEMPQLDPGYPNCNLPVMEQPPTFHPTVPFVTTIPGGLFPKKTIVIKGFIPHGANRFHINLRAGPGGDVVLHLNPRLDEGGAVVRNSFLGGCWGHEERDISGCNPFQHGRYFDLSIRCGNHRFKVFAEGQPLFDFHHRVPAGPHVDVLEIEGDVVLSYVHF